MVKIVGNGEKMKKVSIVMPAYNVEKTIQNAIDSVLKQTYEGDYELIIIDDHSIDHTEEICKKNIQLYPNKIKYYKNDKNKKGVSSARNLGIEKSNSQYLIFIDADDIYDCEMIKTMTNEIEKNENDIVVCGYQKITLKNGKKRNFISQEIQTTNIQEMKNTIELLQAKELFNGSSCKIYNLKIIKENQIKFNEDIDVGEDYRFNIDYVRHTNRMKVLPECLYYYYISEYGLSSRYTEERLTTKLNNVLHHKTFYKEKNLNVDYPNKLYLLTFFSGIATIVSFYTKKEAVNKIKEQIKKNNIENEINIIKSQSKGLKINVLRKIASIKNTNIIWLIGWLSNKAKKIYKKLKIE